MSCSGSVGYRGYIKLCNSYVLPFLSCDLTKVQEILPSASSHGGGAGQTNPIYRSRHNFALGRETVEGTVSTEIYGGTGGYASAWTEMLKRAIPSGTDDSNVCDGFDNSCPLVFCPGGTSEIVVPQTGRKALIASMEIRGNNGGVVQSTFRIISAGATWNDTGTAPAVGLLQYETVGNTDDSNPLPYWAANFSCTGSGETGDIASKITDWSITINNNLQPVFTFDGNAYASDIVLGQQEVSGNLSYYSTTGSFVERLTNGAVITLSLGANTLNIPFTAWGRCPIPNSGPNSLVTRNCEFMGFAKQDGKPAIYWS